MTRQWLGYFFLCGMQALATRCAQIEKSSASTNNHALDNDIDKLRFPERYGMAGSSWILDLVSWGPLGRAPNARLLPGFAQDRTFWTSPDDPYLDVGHT